MTTPDPTHAADAAERAGAALAALQTDIEALDGVGPKTRALFEKVAGPTVGDLLLTAPTGVVERLSVSTVQGAPVGAMIAVEVEIGEHRPPPGPPRRGAGPPYRIVVRDAAVEFQLVFFRANPAFLEEQAPTGARRVVSGKLEIYDGVAQIVHPDHIAEPGASDAEPTIEPSYALTAGLSLKMLRRALTAAVALAPDPPEWLDPEFARREAWPGWRDAVRALHAPERPGDVEPQAPARRRLAYDELLAHQLALRLARDRVVTATGQATHGDGRLRARLLDALPFTPTGAQTRAAAEIADDMAGPDRMMRLLQGDVGAGKTLVAFLAMLVAVEAGGQAALMAPTEILARQHAASILELADRVGVSVALVTGRDKGRARDETLEEVAAGRVDVVIGTHALFQKDVAFHDLRLAVIDEQHRFGVAQRMALGAKGAGAEADVLLMTATPIPRSLALARFGDMEISVLDEKPPGRKPIDTKTISLDRVDEVVAGVARALDRGAKAYWVCPLVEDSAVSDLAAAEARARALGAVLGPERVALVHGRLHAAEKDAAMARFVDGPAQLLVATTVIEVGVNVPAATVMVIEHAERFGLAQLHQLRGRVGRGSAASHCLLVYGGPLTAAGKARLAAMRESEDGFFLAEEDLRLRGAGDLLGVKQSGLPAFRVADIERDPSLMQIAQDDARLVLARDPDLTSPRGQALRLLLRIMRQEAASSYLAAG